MPLLPGPCRGQLGDISTYANPCVYTCCTLPSSLLHKRCPSWDTLHPPFSSTTFIASPKLCCKCLFSRKPSLIYPGAYWTHPGPFCSSGGSFQQTPLTQRPADSQGFSPWLTMCFRFLLWMPRWMASQREEKQVHESQSARKSLVGPQLWQHTALDFHVGGQGRESAMLRWWVILDCATQFRRQGGTTLSRWEH